jgi:hypothetical protein
MIVALVMASQDDPGAIAAGLSFSSARATTAESELVPWDGGWQRVQPVYHCGS